MKCFVLIQTIALCALCILAGGARGILGPTLPDLACLLNVQLNFQAYVLLVKGITAVVGNFLVPKALDIMSINRLLALLALITCTFFFSLPYTRNIYMTYLAVSFVGLAVFPSFQVAYMRLTKLWPTSPRVSLLALGLSALGSVASPLLLAPFLSDGILTRKFLQAKSFHHEPFINSSLRLISNTSHYTQFCENIFTLMYIPYIVFGAFCAFLVLIFFAVDFVQKRRDCSIKENGEYELLNGSSNEKPQRARSEYLLMAAMFVYFVSSQAHYTYSVLLPTYGNRKLQQGKETMSLMSSVFWLTFLVGRFSPCVLPSYVKQIFVIVVYFIGLLCGDITLWMSRNNPVNLWIATGTLGLFYGPRLPVNLIWTRNIIPDTTGIVAMKFVANGLGTSYGYLVGLLMHIWDVDAFVYMMTVLDALNFSSFICIIFMCKYLRKPYIV